MKPKDNRERMPKYRTVNFIAKEKGKWVKKRLKLRIR